MCICFVTAKFDCLTTYLIMLCAVVQCIFVGVLFIV
jgi:hypothetical protein